MVVDALEVIFVDRVPGCQNWCQVGELVNSERSFFQCLFEHALVEEKEFFPGSDGGKNGVADPSGANVPPPPARPGEHKPFRASGAPPEQRFSDVTQSVGRRSGSGTADCVSTEVRCQTVVGVGATVTPESPTTSSGRSPSSFSEE